MAGTSILATICAERLTKFLTRYSKAQSSHTYSPLRSSVTNELFKPTNVVNPPARPAPVERKFSLWQSSENHLQKPTLEKPKPMHNIYGYPLAKVNNQQRTFVDAMPIRNLMNVSRTFLAANQSPRMFHKLQTDRVKTLAKYASVLHQNISTPLLFRQPLKL
ncbi:uncharacterized protein LOC108596211 [Drosophila busckii]|uniref:uncharacterized protein LOC108596211 n=1 Tax=Drosophila busckii TaxID=30019 RepID=UPI00083F48AF|nr:uncharacterized protein LOC108596211 [Drosophila busckii]